MFKQHPRISTAPVAGIRQDHADPSQSLAIAEQRCGRSEFTLGINREAAIGSKPQQHVPVGGGLVPPRGGRELHRCFDIALGEQAYLGVLGGNHQQSSSYYVLLALSFEFVLY